MKYIITILTLSALGTYAVLYMDVVANILQSEHKEIIMFSGILSLFVVYTVMVQIFGRILETGAYRNVLALICLGFLLYEISENKHRLARMGLEEWMPFLIIAVLMCIFAWKSIQAGYNRTR